MSAGQGPCDISEHEIHRPREPQVVRNAAAGWTVINVSVCVVHRSSLGGRGPARQAPTSCCPRATSGFFILTAEHAFKDRHVKMSSENKTFPCSSTWGKDYSTNKTWQMFNIICKSSGAFSIAWENIKIKTQKSFLYCLPASPIFLLLTSFIPHLPSISHGKMKSCSPPNTNTVQLLLPFLFGPLLFLQRGRL